MKLTVLTENTSPCPGYHTGHGLSFLISLSDGRTLLFDFGESGAFADNAARMGFDLSCVNAAFLSHGHYDHGGGLSRFLALNATAPVYVQRTAFGDFYKQGRSKTAYVGLPHDEIDRSRLHFLDGSCRIGDIEVLAGIAQKRPMPEFFSLQDGQRLPDRFCHEQSIVLTEHGRRAVIAGCCHCGADAIAHAAAQSGPIHAFVGGFHLSAWDLESEHGRRCALSLAQGLLETGAMCYTGHCTGTAGYEFLKPVMREHISYLSTGMTVEL